MVFFWFTYNCDIPVSKLWKKVELRLLSKDNIFTSQDGTNGQAVLIDQQLLLFSDLQHRVTSPHSLLPPSSHNLPLYPSSGRHSLVAPVIGADPQRPAVPSRCSQRSSSSAQPKDELIMSHLRWKASKGVTARHYIANLLPDRNTLVHKTFITKQLPWHANVARWFLLSNPYLLAIHNGKPNESLQLTWNISSTYSEHFFQLVFFFTFKSTIFFVPFLLEKNVIDKKYQGIFCETCRNCCLLPMKLQWSGTAQRCQNIIFFRIEGLRLWHWPRCKWRII